jgi:hypothetical protein
MHRLILRWCSNAPILNVLFSMAAHSNATTQRLNTEKDVIAPLVFQNRQSMERYHDIDNEMVAHTFGGGACAGAMMVVLNNDLMRYKDDFKQAADKWETGSPQIEGRSFGSIVTAAAANFRHHDEWARTNPPKSLQLVSIRVIADVLKQQIAPNGNRHPFRHNVCPDLLEVLSGGDFERLNQRFFAFAKKRGGLIAGRTLAPLRAPLARATPQATLPRPRQTTAPRCRAGMIAGERGTLEEVSAFLIPTAAIKSSPNRDGRTGLIMKYRGVEYTVVQGIERGVWKWSVNAEGRIVTGNEQTRPRAVTEAEKAIDRALVGRTGTPLQPD